MALHCNELLLTTSNLQHTVTLQMRVRLISVRAVWHERRQTINTAKDIHNNYFTCLKFKIV